MSLSSAAAINACTQYFSSQYPNLVSCQQLIPVPVYADVAITGVVTGATGPAGVLATSTGCAHISPTACSSSIYSLSTAKAVDGLRDSLAHFAKLHALRSRRRQGFYGK